MVLEVPLRPHWVASVATISGAAAWLDICDIPGFCAETLENCIGMHGSGSDLVVVWLEDDASLVSPVFVEAEKEVLKGHEVGSLHREAGGDTIACMKRLFIAGLVALSSIAFAQLPKAEPGEEMKKLAWQVGSWSGNVKWTMPGMEGDSTMTWKAEWEGPFLKSTSVMVVGGEKMTETSFMTYDVGSKKYVIWTFTNMSINPRIERGTLEGNSMVMVSDPWDIGMGEPSVSRATLKKISDKECTFALEFMMGADWAPVSTGTFKKK